MTLPSLMNPPCRKLRRRSARCRGGSSGPHPGGATGRCTGFLCTVGGEPSFLFTKRTDDVPTHKGQVAFPGGMTDPGDKDPVATAVRETMEEVGFPESSIRVLGMSHDVRAITGVPVTPVIGFLGEIPEPAALSVEQREIAATFTLTLKELMNPETRRRVQHEPRGSYPSLIAGPGRWG